MTPRRMDTRTLRSLDYFVLLAHLKGRAKSEPGAKACERLVPVSDPETLFARTALLNEALDAAQEVTAAVSSFPELEGVFACLDRDDYLDEDGLWGIQLVIRAARQAWNVLQTLDPERYEGLHGLLAGLSWPERAASALDRCLDPEGGLKDESSPELLSIRQEVRRIHSRCTKKVTEYLQQEKISDFLQDDYLTISADRYVLALKTNFKGRLQGIIHDYSQTGETCYVEPLLLVELNNTLQELKQEEREAKQRILRSLTSMVSQERERIQALFDWMVRLDLLQAKVALAGAFHGRSAVLREDGPLCLKQVKHPLLVLDQERAKPVDIELRPGQRGLIVSGGNAGGKTVCLKTLGLVALMALSALPVPVEEGSTLPLWRQIFVFIGDEQSLQDNQSTFTAQIDHLQADWARMDGSGLVLLDEFGAGTDPSQGAALAQAVLDALLDKGAWVVAATHFPALKAYGLTREQVRAATVLFDPETQLPLYTLGYDQVGGSRALDVARDHGLPAEILNRAEEYLLLDGKDSSQVMTRLNDLAVAREQEITRLEEQRAVLDEEKKRLQERYEERARRLLEDIGEHSRRIMADWKAGKRQRKEALKSLAQEKERLREEIGPSSQPAAGSRPLHALTTGEVVNYRTWGKPGVVLDIDLRRARAKLEVGGVALWVPESEIEAREVDGRQRSEPSTVAVSSARTSGSVRLDLRGMRAEEAAAALKRSLDQALLQGRREMEVIHGRGTGALRRAVHDELSRMPGIEEYHLADEQQGGDGVTIVELA